MRRKQSKLRRIIEDEIKSVLDDEDMLKNKNNAKYDAKLLSVKDDEEEEDEDLEEINIDHDSLGQFSDEKKSKCKSSYFVDKERKRDAGGLTDKHETGRGRTKTGQGKYRCKDNEPKWENLFREFAAQQSDKTPHDETVAVAQGDKEDMYDCAKQRQEDKHLLKKLKHAVEAAKNNGNKDCPLSYEDAVRVINTLEKASKGKAFDPPKKT